MVSVSIGVSLQCTPIKILMFVFRMIYTLFNIDLGSEHGISCYYLLKNCVTHDSSQTQLALPSFCKLICMSSSISYSSLVGRIVVSQYKL